MTSKIGRFNYFTEGGRCVTFVDTPGFDDSREEVTDTDILREIASFLDVECVIYFPDLQQSLT
jgi:GTPase Era involved in 16S rRNA processing